MADRSKVVRRVGGEWAGVRLRRYKADDGTHRDVTRRTLLGDADDEQALNAITRYFEIAPGGHSTLERHRHPHSVVVLQGSGQVVLGGEVHAISHLDCVYVAPGTLHQFLATGPEPLGFLCVVDRERDRPIVADGADLEALPTSIAVGVARARRGS